MIKKLLLWILTLILLISCVNSISTAGLTSYYSFDVNVTGDDIGTRTLSVGGGTPTVNLTNFKVGTGSLALDGSSDWVHNTAWNITGDVYSFSLWYKTQTNADVGNRQFMRIQDAGGAALYWSQSDGSSKHRALIVTDGGNDDNHPDPPSNELVNWNMVTLIVNGSTNILYYINDTKVDLGASVGTPINLNSNLDLSIGSTYTGSEYFIGLMDEISFWEVALTQDNVTDLFNNGNGINPLNPPPPPITSKVNVSLNEFDIEIDDLNFNSNSYIIVSNVSINLGSNDWFSIKGGGGLSSTHPVSSGDVSMKLTINGVSVFDNIMRTISSNNDRGVFTIPMSQYTFNSGSNEIITWMKEDLSGNINLDEFSLHFDNNKTNIGNLIDSKVIEETVFDFFQLSDAQIQNFTFEKTVNSTTLVDVQHLVSSTLLPNGATSMHCYAQNHETGEKTPTYNNYIDVSGKFRSTGMNYISQIPTIGTEVWKWICGGAISTIKGNISINFLAMKDTNNNSIGNLQENITNVIANAGSTNILLYNDYEILNGSIIDLVSTIVFNSDSGTQEGSNSPIFNLSSNVSNCNVALPRSLNNNNDIGTVKLYLECSNLSVGDLIDVSLDIIVATGETVTITSASISGYEANKLITTINQIPPVIKTTSVLSPNSSTFTLTDDLIIEYFNGTYIFNSTIFDVEDDIDIINISILNKTGSVIYTGSSSFNLIPSSLFVDFTNQPLNFSIFVNDTGNNIATLNINFSFSDSIDPICNFSDAGTITGDPFQFNVGCSDENFYSLNVTCEPDSVLGTQTYAFQVEGLNVISYLFDEAFQLDETLSCNATFCDGHTDNLIAEDWDLISSKDKKLKAINSDVSLAVNVSSLKSFDLIYNVDRYNFKIVTLVSESYLEFSVISNEKIFIMGNKPYHGWLITGDYWIDFEELDILWSDVERISDNEVLVKVQLTKLKNVFEFKSIGRLNCVSSTFTLTATPDEVLGVGVCPTSIAGNLTLIIMLCLSFAFMIIGVTWDINIIGMLGSLLLTFLSWSLVNCFSVAGWVVAGSGAILFVWFAFIRFPNYTKWS